MPSPKILRRQRIQNRIRARIQVSADRPRITVFRSLKYNYAQIVDDKNGQIIAYSHDLKFAKNRKTENAKQVGLDLAKKALEKNIKAVVFDRRGYKYHGRIAAIANGLREGGLNF